MEPKVRCDISSCVYNLGRSHCGAQKMEISYNQIADSQQTICNTYERAMYDNGDNIVLNTGVNASNVTGTAVGTTNINPIALCNVEECRFHQDDGHCHARAISITENQTSECLTYKPK